MQTRTISLSINPFAFFLVAEPDDGFKKPTSVPLGAVPNGVKITVLKKYHLGDEAKKWLRVAPSLLLVLSLSRTSPTASRPRIRHRRPTPNVASPPSVRRHGLALASVALRPSLPPWPACTAMALRRPPPLLCLNQAICSSLLKICHDQKLLEHYLYIHMRCLFEWL